MRSIVFLALVLAACASAPSVSGNQNYVSVNTASYASGNERVAGQYADRFCHQFGKSARYNRQDGWRFIYDCM